MLRSPGIAQVRRFPPLSRTARRTPSATRRARSRMPCTSTSAPRGSTSMTFVPTVTGTSSWVRPRRTPSTGAVRTVAPISATSCPCRTRRPLQRSGSGQDPNSVNIVVIVSLWRWAGCAATRGAGGGSRPSSFGAAVAFAYLTPGPVLITATFVDQPVGGLFGALTATLGAFLDPWALAAATAPQIKRFAQSEHLRAFGSGAVPAVIGIFGVAVLSLGREAFVSWPYVGIGAVVFALAAWTRMPPVLLLGGGGVLGWLFG